MNNLRRKTLAAASAVTLGAGLALIGVPAPVAAAGPETSYLVLAPQGNGTAKAAARVAAADGTVVAAYDKIGVLVARSSAPDFATRVAGAGVESVASTAGLGTALDEGETVEVPAADVVRAAGDPTAEPLYGQQWDMDMIRVPQAHAVTGGSPSVVVGVLDSGISSSHPDLATQIAKDKSTSCIGGVTDTAEPAWNPTTSDHGTHVAGTIAAAVNGVGVTGVAPGVKVAAVKVVNDDGYIFPEAAVCGFMWAAEHGFQLTNNSYYIDPWQLNCRNDARQRPVWQAVQRALRYSQSQGVLHVASAGNANFDLAHKITDTGSPNNGTPEERANLTNACLVLPAEAPGVVTVAAVGPTGDKSYYSSYGQGVIDVTAPGGDTRFRTRGARSTSTDGILSTTFNTATRTNGWGYKQGTSMSGPHAAGVAALALSAHPGMTPGQLSSFLERTAVAKSCPAGVYNPVPLIPAGPNAYDATCSGGKRNGFYGAGVVDAYNAVK
ncbi:MULTISPECIES: S8 family serine peptidase [unclassified Micromonospora]|uniref:S8 family peptidase n=1 Tax=unclassified Micromonospora TaxID=2617518 RepID=UPI0003EED8D1|nr:MULTISPECIES: S8 family serine peptidase [unclassified Micromonospora]EWM63429.1 protease [Micromonospora sp. M42]MCK1809102.1 S8 family serine peptidase [Micromonospora sp. R42106]MCK1833585.1 S8 family serine peptidase [Micromonospora sp. R42003]MCK1845628.1 S8 family serine peptidase [Micromonospora sp. R42004]MCM1019264.1 S8 family serine peptidase [Micromonospora sp. XM-20-01]